MSQPTSGRSAALLDEAALDAVRFDDRGLVPVVAQARASGQVLMVAWADRSALEATLETGVAHFWSRSRDELWRKGETSGNELRHAALFLDCDGDTVLLQVDPVGPACHTGAVTCFDRDGDAAGPQLPELAQLWKTLEQRAADRPADSYTVRLLDDRNLRLKKLGEETTELVVALAGQDRHGATEEAADLVYHLMAALLAMGIEWSAVEAVLAKRGA